MPDIPSSTASTLEDERRASTQDLLTPSTPPPTPTPLHSFASGLPGLVEKRTQAAETVAKGAEKQAAEYGAVETELKADFARQAKERAEAKPPPVTLPKTPSTALRAFLQPSDSILGQVQTALVGIGQLAMGFAGLRGGGAAIAATAALKGAAEGWQQGDAERVQREFAKWQAESDRLIKEHELAREQYQDLLLDQRLTNDQKFGLLRILGERHKLQQVANAARLGNYDALIGFNESQQAMAAQYLKTAAEMKHWAAQEAQAKATAARLEAQMAETKRYHAVQERNAQERLGLARQRYQLAKETSGPLLKLEAAERTISQRLDDIVRVKEAVALLDAEGVLNKGKSWLDKLQAQAALQSKPNRPDIGKAAQDLATYGMPLLVSREVAGGLTAGMLRLKSIAEAETNGGNALGMNKDFWDEFLQQAEKGLRTQREDNFRHLERLGRATSSPQSLVVDPSELE